MALPVLTKFKLREPGELDLLKIDYKKFGEFIGEGTANFKYIIKDKIRLARAVGQGIYPNQYDFTKDEDYQLFKKMGRLEGSPWEHLYTNDPYNDFFVWTTCDIEEGIKQFFIAEIFRYADLIIPALKAYYAAMVHFPRSICWSADNTSFFWYVGMNAFEKINLLCRQYPELEIKLSDADAHIKGVRGEQLWEASLSKERLIISCGHFEKFTKADRIKSEANLKILFIKKTRGHGKVKLLQFNNEHWQIRVENKPFLIKGITYTCTKIGETPHQESFPLFPEAKHLTNWMFQDENKNNKVDGPYDSWVDKNRNNRQDDDESVVGDLLLLKEMGCNCIRLYHKPVGIKYDPSQFNKPLLRDMYNNYGLRVILGDFLGAYTIGTGTEFARGTDYRDKIQCENMKNIIRDLVLDHKDEPYVLLWILGNENNVPTPGEMNVVHTNAFSQAVAYAKFLNEVAEMIHELDPDHPVAIGNCDNINIRYLAEYAPAIDIFGTNSYRGKDGFGYLWKEVKEVFDRPVLITEFGCDCYHPQKGLAEQEQAMYYEGCWKDILYNRAGKAGKGNSIGGIVFEWMDEWWKGGFNKSPYFHKIQPDIVANMPDGWLNEEWMGICGQGEGNHSPFLRELRQGYFIFKKMWTKWPDWE